MTEISEKEVEALKWAFAELRAIGVETAEDTRRMDNLSTLIASLAREANAEGGEPGELDPHEFASKQEDPDWCHWCGEHRSHPAHPAPQPSGPVGIFSIAEHAAKLAMRWGKPELRSLAGFDLLVSAIEPAIRTALTAGKPEQAVPSGWKLVPEEPTDKMTFIGQSMRYDAVNSIGEIYRKMLSAAPAAPTAGGGDAR